MRNDADKTKKQLLRELAEMRQRVSDLEASKAGSGQIAEPLPVTDERYQDLYDSAPIAYFSVGTDGRINKANTAAIKLLGYSQEELKRMEVLELYSDESKEKAEKLFEKFTRGSGWTNEEMVYRRKDGQKIYGLLSTSPNLDENGQVLSGRSVVVDITGNKRMEEALRDNEARFRQLFEYMSSGVAIYEAIDDGNDFVFKDFNRAAERIENISRDALIGKRVTEIFPGVKEFGLLEVFQRVWQTGVPEHLPVSEYRDERITGWRENYVYKLPSEEIITIYDDITERKKAEQALADEIARRRIFVEQSRDGIVVLDQDGHVYEANHSFAEMLGYSDEEVLGLSVLDWEYMNPPEQTLEMLRTADDSGSYFETRHRRKDGSTYDVEISANAVTFSGQRLIFCICRDSSGRIRAKEELTLRAQLLDNASDGICLIDSEGEYVYVNDMYCRAHGYTKEELIGTNIRRMDRNATDEWIVWLKNELQQKGVVVFESTHRHKDGSELFLEVRSRDIETGGVIYNLSIERDITERKHAEESLRESENFNARLLESSPNPIIVINPDSSIRYVNPSMEQLTGYSFEELIGTKAPFPYWNKDEIETATRRLQEDMIFGVKGHEVQFVRKNGEKFRVSITNTPIGTLNKLEYLVSTWVDITEQKEMEELYSTVVNNTPSGIYIYQDDKFQFTNPQFQRLTGYSAEELNEIKSYEIVHPEDREMVRKSAVNMMKGKLKTPYEFRVINSSGETRWAIETVTSINYKGKRATLGNFMDNTELKQMEAAARESEEKFSQVFYANPNPMTIVAPDTGFINDVNKAFEELTGFTREECLGNTITGLGLWISREERREFITVLEERDGIQNFETKMRISSGEIRDVLLSIETIMISGEPYKVISTDDITERKKMQENLIVTDRLASVGELATGIAHELNNPLTSVIGFSDLLMERDDLPRDIRDDVSIINKESVRASQVARHLLTFARKHPDEKKAVNINEVLLLVMELRAYEQKVSNIKVVYHLEQNIPPVLANDFQLQQVFVNIIINAEHFMIEAHEKGTLVITTAHTENTVRITITDDGPGIPPDYLTRIFDPFFTTKEIGKGTGLGLSICYGIITEHEGRIWAENKAGEGATFIIELPVYKNTLSKT
jgi:PAS domain S-box-containing protein